MFRNNLKLILRKLRKEKLYSFVNIFGLTIGLTAFLLIALYVRDELSFDQFHKNKENIYRIVSESENLGKRGMVASDFVDYFNEIPEVTSFTRVTKIGLETMLESNDKQLYAEDVLFVDPNFFDFFTFQLNNSSSQGAFSEPGQAVITESLAKALFSEENPIGKQIQVEKGDFFVITSVVKNPPKNSTIQFDLLLNKQDFFKNDYRNTHGVKTAITYISCSLGHDQKIIEDKIQAARDKPDYSRFTLTNDYSLLPLTSQRLYAKYDRAIFEKNDILYVKLFSGIGFVVLLLAVINYVNMVTAQSLKRMKEVGLRKVIGATKSQMIFYQLTESFFFTMISFFLAFAIAERLMPVFNSMLGKSISLDYLSSEFFVWTVFSSLLLGLLAGLYPAFYIARVKPLALLKKGQTKGGSVNWLKKGLVLFQFLSTAVLVSVLIIMSRQMNFLNNKELGYKKDFVLSVPLDRDSTRLYDKLKNSILSIGGVESASLTGFRVGGGTISSYMDSPNTQGDVAKSVASETIFADGDLLNTLGVEFIWKSSKYDAVGFTGNQVLVNQTLAEAQGWLNNAEGERLYGWSDRVGKEVVGIVADFNLKSLKETIEPIVINPLENWGTSNLLIKIDGVRGFEMIEQIGDQYESIFDRPFSYSFLDEQVKDFYKKEAGQFMLFKVFSTLALFISLLGLVGLTIYTVEQRRKEVSIRKVLGASIQNLLLLLNKEYTLLVFLAFLIASPIAYYAMQDWLAEFKYRISISPLLFVAAFLGFLALSWMVTLLQSLKVSRENPADTLREE